MPPDEGPESGPSPPAAPSPDAVPGTVEPATSDHPSPDWRHLAPGGPTGTRQRLYLVIAGGLVVVAVAAVIYAANTNPARLHPTVDPNNLPVGPRAPVLVGIGWADSAPVTAADLSGRVVLYDFWTYSCVNCVDTIPYIRSWYDHYRSDGLVVIGIHTPEFDFERNHANVLRAIRSLGVTWPVAFDDTMKVWNAFRNDSWPADYVADRAGHLRYVSLGEGNYGQTENVLRTLLGVAPGSPRATNPAGAFVPGQPTADVTPETYLGTARGIEAKPGTTTYQPHGNPAVDTAELSGTWTGTAEYVRAGSAASAIVLHYQAQQVNLVLAPPPGASVQVVVQLDGAPLPPPYRTRETVVGPGGQTSVLVTAADMYRLVSGPAVEGHTLRITAGTAGLLAYDFTFEP